MKKLMQNIVAFIGLSLLLAGPAQTAATVTFYHHDALGSVVASSHMDGWVQWNEEYQPYGEKIYQTEDFAGNSDDFYTGKNYDRELDLTYFGARWYDAKQGRFLSMDPVGVDLEDIHSFNRYHYTSNNPYKYIDPDGNSPYGPSEDQDGDSIPNNIDNDHFKPLRIWTGGPELIGLDGLPAKGGGGFRLPSIGGQTQRNTVGELRAAGKKDAHHIIQDAAVRNLTGYQTNKAPGVQLQGPANRVGTPHYVATQVQRQAGGGTYGAERRIGYKALRRAGVSRLDARQQIKHADEYFRGIGVSGSTATRQVRNRTGSND